MREVISKAILIAAALVVAVCANAPASAQQQDERTGVEYTPALFERDITTRSISLRTRVLNHEDEPRHMSLSIAGLGHDLAGNVQFLEPGLATTALRLSESSFTLDSDTSREVIVTGSIPSGERALYWGVITRFSRVGESPGGAIDVRNRVAGLFLVRGPKPWIEKVEVSEVSILPGPPEGPHKVYAIVKNIGNVHVKPRGNIDIFQNGERITTVELKAETIIPTFARRLVGEWTPPPGLTGRVDLVATIENPNATGQGSVDFGSGGTLQQPGAEISNLRTSIFLGPRVSFVLTNIGTIPIAPRVEIEASENRRREAQHSRTEPEMAPGESREIEWKPSNLPDGIYLITARAKYRDQLLDQDVAGLRVGQPRSLTLWVVLPLVLILLLLGIFFFLFWRRRKKKPEGEVATSRRDTPVPLEGSGK